MSGKYELKEIGRENYEEWNKLVKESKEGSIFHKPVWLNSTGLNFLLVGCYTGDQLRGGGAFTFKERGPYNQSYIKNGPLTPYTGPIFENQEGKRVTTISNKKKMNEKISNYINRKYKRINITLSPFCKDIQPFIWDDFASKVTYTYILNLDDLDKVWNRMDSSTRRDIRKAKKDGLEVKKTDNFETTMKLVRKTFDRQDMSIEHFEDTAWRYYKELKNKNLCKSFITYDYKGRPIASVFIIWDEKRSYYLLGGYDPEHGHHGGTSMAMWEAIQYTSNVLELSQFDFEGSMIKSIEKYFRKFGGQIYPKYGLIKKSPIEIIRDSASEIYYNTIRIIFNIWKD